MLSDRPVLIVEDNVYTALDLVAAVEELNGQVVGPVGTASEALRLLETEHVEAIVLSGELTGDDVAPLASALATKKLPCVIQTSGPVPHDLMGIGMAVPVLMRPVRASEVVCLLAQEIAKAKPT
jgi:hypothetical protein